LIDWLEKNGYKNIVILDNCSTLPELLNYYSLIPYKTIYLERNYGHMALWDSGIIKQYISNYFVYTDPDIVPIEECPEDFMKIFLKTQINYYKFKKVGFGLKIDDIPDYNIKKKLIINWENKFWQRPINDNIFIADIDTTFALYSPFYDSKCYEDGFFNALRTGYPYMARHMTWYEDESKLSKEIQNYIDSSSNSSSWTNKSETRYL
jgi:hypothetical protein